MERSPLGPLTIWEPQYQEISKFYVVHERRFQDFLSLFLSFFLSFFPLHPYGLGGGISLSPVNPLDYVKKIGKFNMEIPPKNLTRLQGYKDDE